MTSAPAINCEWGEQGLARLGPQSDVIIIVDVLSFSTCLDIAVSRGTTVYPFTWKDSRAAEFAEQIGADLAGPRGQATFSLSPASFFHEAASGRVVLPSPNGATLSLKAADNRVLAGCFRNAAAVARAAQHGAGNTLLLAAGERWQDGSLRPCLEDWLGAGALINHLSGQLSPEAEATRAAFRSIESDLPRLLLHCTSGKELVDRGYEVDVELAAQINISDAVPALRDRAYTYLES